MHIIAGLYRQRRLATPKSTETKPTASRLREALFNICQHSIEGAHFLDLFAGSGAMGLEALSRGAASATFVENSREAIRCIQKNIAELKVEEQATVLAGDVWQVLKRLDQRQSPFTIIYADPPYGIKFGHSEELYSEHVIRFIDQSTILAPGGLLFVEEASNQQPDPASLQTLTLKNSRRMGSTALLQYQKHS